MTTQGADSDPGPANTHRYLAEVHLPIQGGRDLSWIALSLNAACRRLTRTNACLQIVSAVYSPEGELLTCILEAASWKDVSDLFAIALLPPARILEVVEVEENGRWIRPS